MNEYLNHDIKLKIKGLAYYQIVGGIIGFGLTVMAFIQATATNGLLISLLAVFAGLFGFSILCGQQLLKSNLKRGLKLSTANQILQVFNFALLGYSYKYVAGLLLSLGVDLTSGFNLTFNFSIPAFQFDINQETETLNIGFNLIAVFLVYYIDKLQKDIELKKELFDASKNVTTEEHQHYTYQQAKQTT